VYVFAPAVWTGALAVMVFAPAMLLDPFAIPGKLGTSVKQAIQVAQSGLQSLAAD
jgi:hypothetical protein